MKLICSALLALFAPLAVSAQPYEGFPFDEQLPKIARANQFYSFQIANDTYLSNLGQVTYSVENTPDWLSFDPNSRTFAGTPSSSDVSSNVTFSLIGSDSESSFSQLQSIIVSGSTGPAPSSEYTVLSQLAEVGQTDGVNGLVLSPGEIFNITFDAKTFTSDDNVAAYYGRSSDRSPLPNWLFFDSSNLRFSGVAPAANSEIAPGFSYSFILIATDYAGFTASSVEFDIITGAHSLTTTLNGVININGSAGDVLDYNIPLESVYTDGVQIATSNISNIQLAGAPDWLSLSDYKLVGTVPDDYVSTNDIFNVTIDDLYDNAVVLFFAIESIKSLFAVDSFRSTNATRGSYFQYYFLPSDFTDYSSTNVSVKLDDDWLSFHSSNLTVNGETPEDFDDTTITVIATSSNTENELSFKIYGVDPIETSTKSSSSSHSQSSSSSRSSWASSSGSSASSTSTSTAEATSTSTASVTSTPVNVTNKSTTNKKALAIGLGVSIPLFALLVAAILLFLCCFRKRKETDKEPGSSTTPKISKPILGNPANGLNNIPSDGFNTPSTASPEKEDWTEPKRLSTLNVLKLDEKNFSGHPSSSSSTNIGSFSSQEDSSIYQDALLAHSTDQLIGGQTHRNDVRNDAIPKRSWRQTIDSRINRDSLNSLATVSTNELLSIKLAEDDDIKRDPRKSSLGFRDSAFLGSTASSILSRDDSGNVHLLNEDGTVIESLNKARQRASRGTELDVLKEELTPHIPQGFSTDVSYSTLSSAGDAFYPVNIENGEVQWQHQQKNSKQESEGKSKARLIDFNDRGRADTSNDTTQSLDGETAEIESM